MPLVAHFRGKLYWYGGKRQEVQERLTTATTMFSEMDMRVWLEQGQTEMSELA